MPSPHVGRPGQVQPQPAAPRVPAPAQGPADGQGQGQGSVARPPRTVTFDEGDDLDVPDFLK